MLTVRWASREEIPSEIRGMQITSSVAAAQAMNKRRSTAKCIAGATRGSLISFPARLASVSSRLKRNSQSVQGGSRRSKDGAAAREEQASEAEETSETQDDVCELPSCIRDNVRRKSHPRTPGARSVMRRHSLP